MLITKLVTTEEEFAGIIELSKANLVSSLPVDVKAREGFVTWIYTKEALRAIHAVIPSVIVKDEDIVVGYALSLSPACIDIYPPMAGTDKKVSVISYKGIPLGRQRVYYCGQICVAEGYRGQGLVNILYQFHREHFCKQFDRLVTEISTANPRSLKAHQKIGFRVIETHVDEMDEWDIVLWDWE
jgi:ribosomal protein S18 acetylase RimI-like enzyme